MHYSLGEMTHQLLLPSTEDLSAVRQQPAVPGFRVVWHAEGLVLEARTGSVVVAVESRLGGYFVLKPKLEHTQHFGMIVMSRLELAVPVLVAASWCPGFEQDVDHKN